MTQSLLGHDNSIRVSRKAALRVLRRLQKTGRDSAAVTCCVVCAVTFLCYHIMPGVYTFRARCIYCLITSELLDYWTIVGKLSSTLISGSRACCSLCVLSDARIVCVSSSLFSTSVVNLSYSWTWRTATVTSSLRARCVMLCSVHCTAEL